MDKNGIISAGTINALNRSWIQKFACFCVTIITEFKSAFNIFELHLLKTNLNYIFLEHKQSSKMLKNVLASAGLILFCLTLNGQENRSFDGYGNNLQNREWGTAHSPALRITSTNYSDGIGEINDEGLPMPRMVSNMLFAQDDNINDEYNLSDFVWVFGQFIDHDITLIENDAAQTVLLSVPQDDEWFAPNDFIITARNKVAEGTGTSVANPRNFINEITAFVDGSAVYGSDAQRASWLRTYENGKLKVSNDNLLPWNTTTGNYDDPIDPNAPFMGDDTRLLTKYFVAGDVRANENPLLIGMHTIFVREHNRICDELVEDHPDWTDEQMYQFARRHVSGYIQNITFNEWLPALGVDLPAYSGYNDDMEVGIFNVFSAAAFRIGHTMINSNLLRMDNNGEEISEGSMRLKDAFFNPFAVVHSDGIEPFFKGMGIQVMQKLDCKVINDLRNFLFGAPGAGGMDLASINIFRGRERGLPDYNTIRSDLGLPRVNDFTDITANVGDAAALSELYEDVNNIDPWVGMLAEDHMPNATFGELVMRIIKTQFQLLRDGDRFYFEVDPAFSQKEIEDIRNTRLYDVLMRNTNLSIMQKELFFAMPHEDIPSGPELANEPLAAAAYPNPVSNFTNLKIHAEEDTDVKISIFNSNGQLMAVETDQVVVGKNVIPLDIEASWPRGLYNVLLKTDDHYTIVKLIKE